MSPNWSALLFVSEIIKELGLILSRRELNKGNTWSLSDSEAYGRLLQVLTAAGRAEIELAVLAQFAIRFLLTSQL